MVETSTAPPYGRGHNFRNVSLAAVLAWNVSCFAIIEVYFLATLHEPDPKTAEYVRGFLTVIIAIGFMVSTAAGLLLTWLTVRLWRNWRDDVTYVAGRAIACGLVAGAVGTLTIVFAAFRLDG